MKDDKLFTGESMAAYAVKTVSIHEAKTNFSKLVKRAAEGEAIYIGAYGKPEVTLTAVNQKKINAKLRENFLGCLKGKAILPKGWEEPFTDKEIEEMFYNMHGLEDFEK
jgi:antitoxin (DNA-binding transcriptional repressor) of toxin-antitoxin stability system